MEWILKTVSMGVLLVVVTGNAFGQPECPKGFVGKITRGNKVIICGDLTHRFAYVDTIGIVEEEDAEWLFKWSKSPYRGDHLMARRLMQKKAREGKIVRVPVDTEVEVTADRSAIFRAKIKGTKDEFWFFDKDFFYDSERKDK